MPAFNYNLKKQGGKGVIVFDYTHMPGFLNSLGHTQEIKKKEQDKRRCMLKRYITSILLQSP